MKRNFSEWDEGKKLKRVEKGTNKENKHRKSIYNMLSDSEDYLDDEYDSEYGDVDYDEYETKHYNKRR